MCSGRVVDIFRRKSERPQRRFMDVAKEDVQTVGVVRKMQEESEVKEEDLLW